MPATVKPQCPEYSKCPEQGKAEISSLGYVIGVRPGGVQVVREDNSIDWYCVLVNADEQEIFDGDFVRLYKKKIGGVCSLYARYASYFYKDTAVALTILDLGWQVQKGRLPETERNLRLSPPCLEVSKQLGMADSGNCLERSFRNDGQEPFARYELDINHDLS